MAKAGAKLKLTPKAAKAICEAIQIGTPFRQAAIYGGVTYRTFRYWLIEGENEAARLESLLEQGEENPEPDPAKEKYLHFFHQVEEARANAIVGWVNTINEHAVDRSDPNWARFMLSKHSPEEYGDQPQKIELTGKDGGAIETRGDVNQGAIDKIAALLEKAKERRDSEPSGNS